MGRNRKRKYPSSQVQPAEDRNAIPIPNLPEKYLNIRLRNKRVKMKHLLTFAFDKCQGQDGVLWSAVGDGIEKLISFVEIFKRTKTEFKSQVNKLRFTTLEEDKNNEDKDIKTVPEMFIFVSRDTTKKNDGEEKPETQTAEDTSKNVANETMKSLARLNLKPGQKRPIVDNISKKKKDKKKRKSNHEQT